MIDKAIELDPNDASAYGGRGNSYLRLGQYQRAIQDYDKAMQLDPDDAAPTTTGVFPTVTWASTSGP